MRDERWFVSWQQNQDVGVGVIDVTPAHWAMIIRAKTSKPYVILYAEQISLALASELIHRGNVPYYTFGEEEDCLC